MRINDFDLYKDLLMEKSGLVLTPDKSYLLDSRLTPIAKQHGFDSLDQMTVSLRGIPDTKLVKSIVEAMTTNETSFYRDLKPFNLFEKSVLPYMKETRASKRHLRIWCAAASSGQEPYSLAMLLKENEAKFPGWKFEIVATDISDDILEIAQNGIYTQFEVQRGLPIQLLMKYFKQHGDKWHISDDIKKMIRFSNFNLLNPMTSLGQFDVIFCRNVLIYFDDATKTKVLSGMSNLLPEDGMLFLGGAETVIGITDQFRPLPNARGLYLKPESSAQNMAIAS